MYVYDCFKLFLSLTFLEELHGISLSPDSLQNIYTNATLAWSPCQA